MISELFILLKKHNLKISSAESITGGTFSSLIVNEPGASNYFLGGFICYSNEFKYDILNVDKNIEIVSIEMAQQLAVNSRIKTNANISISFTGNASINGIENKQQGLSYVAISNKNEVVVLEYKSNSKEREQIIVDTAQAGLNFLINFIRQNYK